MTQVVNIFWFRRDLRLEDNTGLYHALQSPIPVIPLFIFDREILDKLENKRDRRVAFIHQCIENLQQKFISFGSTLEVHHGTPLEVFAKLLKKYTISHVFTNHDYEPYAKERDRVVGKLLKESSVQFSTYKDQVIFEKDEVLKDDGKPYTVFTPYSKKWKARLTDDDFKPFRIAASGKGFYSQKPLPVPTLQAIGFEHQPGEYPPEKVEDDVLSHYGKNRDYPGLEGTSKIGVHLRFGTVSIRQLAARAQKASETYLNELIWREFYQSILWHFPQVGEGRAFRSEYENIAWRNNETEFERWCEGKTGYPMVDAGMHELNETGFMHNRVRMVVASFLCKHLLIDWRWGEAYFASRLLDFELASNNGGWQWAAGSGVDAAPYFRIFNPYLQAKKFDPDGTYIRKWVPEIEGFGYPEPIVDHDFARKRCIEVYSKSLKGRS